ncbi:hypothetical protein BDY21DRAFT_54142 [Lineolata rhizophorae]|uniref:Uncharacterized protein n=1 Tax=Lineolata rhizophorae TaxID=578093 RepID=A0A6A6NYK6_9PEZI|nr:hypothetical protein BDY21DRAFT_54142 [Lineolata rhizophorae]
MREIGMPRQALFQVEGGGGSVESGRAFGRDPGWLSRVEAVVDGKRAQAVKAAGQQPRGGRGLGSAPGVLGGSGGEGGRGGGDGRDRETAATAQLAGQLGPAVVGWPATGGVGRGRAGQPGQACKPGHQGTRKSRALLRTRVPKCQRASKLRSNARREETRARPSRESTRGSS